MSSECAGHAMRIESGDHVLYLHGRGDEPMSPPGDLFYTEFGSQLKAPRLDSAWFAQPFGAQVDFADHLMEKRPVLSVGFSWGAYLLLAASLQRLHRRDDFPPLLLLSAVLGIGGNRSPDGRITGFIAPRAKRIRSALGLEGDDPVSVFPKDKLAFIHSDRDNQCPVEPLHRLCSLGYRVQIVSGGHRLDTPEARSAIVTALKSLPGNSSDR